MRRYSLMTSITQQTPPVAVEAAHGPLTSTSTNPQVGFWKPTTPSVQPMATTLQTSQRITKTQQTSCGLANTKPTAAAICGPVMDDIGTMH